MSEQRLNHGVRFTVKEAFPPEDPVARWTLVLIMTLHDLLLVNRRLEATVDEAPDFENVYNARLAASHLWEVAVFLREADRRFEEVRDFVADLPEEARKQYAAVRMAGDPLGAGFAADLRRLRNHFFHYAELIPQAPEYEELTQALNQHAQDAGEIRVGERFTDFRARFADDVASELTFAGSDPRPFVEELAQISIACMNFAYAVLNAYVASRSDRFESF